MSADILLWCGTLSIAVAALVIMAWPAGHRADRAQVTGSTPTRCPLHQVLQTREYPRTSSRHVTASHALYVDRLLDVNNEPWVLTLPSASDRRYLFQVLSGRADVFDETAEHVAWTQPQTYAITGPSWNGELPAGVTEHRSPAPIIWLLGRSESTGTPEDRATAQAILDRISLLPLGLYVKQFAPASASRRKPPR